MEILVLLGNDDKNLVNTFVDMGYTKIIKYTNREIKADEINHKSFHFVSDIEYNTLVVSDVIIIDSEDKSNGDRYGMPRPIGSNKFIVNLSNYSITDIVKLQNLYENQVKFIDLSKLVDYSKVDAVEYIIDMVNL